MRPMTGIGLEWYKCRRRQVPLVCLGLLGAQMVWMGVFLLRQEQEDLAQGWMLLLYNLALVDAIMLPLTAAVLASRNCEGEHKGSTWKLLETMVTPGQLYAAKLGWGTVVLAVLLLARSGLFIALGLLLDLPGGVPWGRAGGGSPSSAWRFPWPCTPSSRGCPFGLPTRRWRWWSGCAAAFWGC